MSYSHLPCGHGKHPGHKREHNEDNYIADPAHGLWLVADGMGGHDCGEYASQIVVDFIQDELRHEATSLVGAIEQSHKVVLLAASQNLGMPGMGSTVVALRMHGDQYEVAWVGDSRAYLWNGHELLLLTRDHSYVQQMFDAGQISQEEADRHPHRNVITQALGAENLTAVAVDRIQDTLYRGEKILLCSDGLSDELSTAEMAALLRKPLTEQQCVERLINGALENGGSDNISVILIGAAQDAPVRPREEGTIPL